MIGRRGRKRLDDIEHSCPDCRRGDHLYSSTPAPGRSANGSCNAARADIDARARHDRGCPTPETQMPTTQSTAAIADAQTKLDAGDLLSARHILNDALLSNSLTDDQIATAKTMIAQSESGHRLFPLAIFPMIPTAA